MCRGRFRLRRLAPGSPVHDVVRHRHSGEKVFERIRFDDAQSEFFEFGRTERLDSLSGPRRNRAETPLDLPQDYVPFATSALAPNYFMIHDVVKNWHAVHLPFYGAPELPEARQDHQLRNRPGSLFRIVLRDFTQYATNGLCPVDQPRQKCNYIVPQTGALQQGFAIQFAYIENCAVVCDSRPRKMCPHANGGLADIKNQLVRKSP